MLPETLSTFSFTKHLPDRRLVTNAPRLLATLSRMIEEQAIVSGPDTLLIIAAQRLSVYAQDVGRYRQLARSLRQIIVLGVPDIMPPEVANILVVPIEPFWHLAHERVVIASGPRCSLGLFARETCEYQYTHSGPRFLGFWSSSTTLIESAVRSFHAAFDQNQPLMPPLIDAHLVLQRAVAA